MSDHERTSSAIDRLTYLFIGAGIGATIALLFAPKPGRELRGDIADASRRGVEYTRETSRRVGEKAVDAYGAATSKAQEIVGTTQAKAHQLIETGKDTVASKREQLHAAIEAGKEAYTEEKERARAKAGELSSGNA